MLTKKRALMVASLLTMSCGDTLTINENQQLQSLDDSEKKEFCDYIRGLSDDLPETIICPKRGPFPTSALDLCGKESDLQAFRLCKIGVIINCFEAISKNLHDDICINPNPGKTPECAEALDCLSPN